MHILFLSHSVDLVFSDSYIFAAEKLFYGRARCQDTEIKFKNSEIDTEETLNDGRKKTSNPYPHKSENCGLRERFSKSGILLTIETVGAI